MSAGPIGTPAVLISGGQPLDAAVFSAAIAPALARFHKPKVAYIGAANGDREGFFETVNTMFRSAGASSMDFLRLARDDADVVAARAVLSAADVIFFSGGEVEDGINWIRRHGLDGMLSELFAQGRQFMGISAGAIMIGAHWVRWDVPGDDSTAALFDCLGLVPATFDTHAEDEDWVELKATLRLMGDGASGYGIPRGGAISADSGGRLVNLTKEYLTYTYKNGHYIIK
ncbi:MAG: Type 1 glutamine amidotransferase-like domain-containing protein [Oscillospiraceae bacterium]|nr:Type 1 glutamine amidotransferase-like domain-containing protein [Oscillospiraceae bacterium]